MQVISQRAVGASATVFLAFFLTPDDFGLVAMMAVFLAIASSAMGSGFSQALVRKDTVTQVDLDTAFICNLVLGVIAYFVLYLVAPFIGEFYNDSRLIVMIRVSGLAVIVSSFGVVQLAILSRNLHFKAQFRATVPASLISGLAAVALAILGAGAWSLIFQTLAAGLITTIILWCQSTWRPTFHFDKASGIDMYGFGYKLFISGLIDTIFRNIYVIVIARIFDSTTAGLFYFANSLKQLAIDQLVQAVQTVSYPALAAVQAESTKLSSGYREIIRIVTYVVFPISLMLASIMYPLFRILFPERWWPAASYAELMFVAGFMYPLHAINLNILKVKGRSDLFLYLEIVKKIITSVILYFTYEYGVIAILYGQIAQSFLAYFANSWFSAKLINYGIKSQLVDIMPAAMLSFLLSAILYSISQLLVDDMKYWCVPLFFVVIATYVVLSHIFRVSAYLSLRSIILQRLAMQSR